LFIRWSRIDALFFVCPFNVSTQLQAYTHGVMLQSLIMAAFCSFGFTLIGLDIPILMGAVTGLFNLVVIPSVVANSVNLHPVQAILGIIIFGSLFGTVGIILAVPAIAAGKIVFKNIYTDIANASLKATP
jgi:predicted PurR-regulated permease PerM